MFKHSNFGRYFIIYNTGMISTLNMFIRFKSALSHKYCKSILIKSVEKVNKLKFSNTF